MLMAMAFLISTPVKVALVNWLPRRPLPDVQIS